MTTSPNPLKILHCFRSPVGGIFRHVRDLVGEQVKAGHQTGIICDSNTGGTFEENLFEQIKPDLALGLHRFPMSRALGPGDIGGLLKVRALIETIGPDVVHTHGAKGGAFGRVGASMLPRGKRPARFYCPHGGSLHYEAGSIKGKIYFALERWLEGKSDGLIFVSGYEQNGYRDKVGAPSCATKLVYNGLQPDEFEPVVPNADATDFVYVGMMRDLKGVDLLLDALPLTASNVGRPISATLIGDGPDRDKYRETARRFGPEVEITFHDPMPARQGFAMGRHLIVPSRAESLPYLVLEACAAQLSMRSTAVGGIPEIFQGHEDLLVAPDSRDALAVAMTEMLTQGTGKFPEILHSRIRDQFSAATMAREVEAFYRVNQGNN